MADLTDRTIDLEPAVLTAIEQRLDKVVLVFPSQPSYSTQQTEVPLFGWCVVDIGEMIEFYEG